MIKYTSIYKDTGMIFGIISISETENLPTDDAHYYVEGSYDGSKYYFDGNTPVEIPPKLNEFSVFNFTSKEWIPDTYRAINDVKQKRQKLLIDSDWTDTLSAKTRLGDDLYNQWQTYRQALRDITTQSGYPTEVVWPARP